MQDEKPPSKLKGLAWLGVAILLGVGFALGLSPLARMVPWSMEKRMASKMGKMLGGFSDLRACSRPEGLESLRALVKRILPLYPEDSEFPLQITVVHGPVVNAFAALGGQIYVYDGLLRQTESAEELAGVLAHEIEHVRRRHIIEGVILRLSFTGIFRLILGDAGTSDPAIAAGLFNLQFSRHQEREADEGGLKRLRDAQVDNAGFRRFFERLKNSSSVPAILSDHPTNEDRIQLITRYQTPSPQPVLSADEWKHLRAICD